MLFYGYACVLPICALLMLLYPLLQRKRLPLVRALRHSATASVLLLVASHLMLFFAYLYAKDLLWDVALPVPLVGVAVALMFALSCVILLGLFGCSRAILRKCLPQE